MALTNAQTHGAAKQRPLAGIVMRLIAALCISLMIALVKLAETRGVHIIESLFYRQIFALPFVLLLVMQGSGMDAVKTKRPVMHVWRTIVGMTGMVFNFWAVTLLPLAEATALSFTAPIIATIFAIIFLKEVVGIHRWAAIILSFFGVLIIVQPGGGITAFGAFIAMCAATFVASVSIIIRLLGQTESAATTVFWFTVGSLPILLVLMVFYGQSHPLETWPILFGIGLFGGVAQMALTQSLRLAPVSIILPIDYSSMIYATIIGIIVWQAWPSPMTWIGAPIIILAGIYIAWREHKSSIAKASTTA